MKHQARQLVLVVVFALCATLPTEVRAETETIDLKALAKKARPAVVLLVVSDAAGKEIATGTGFLVSSDGKLITNHHVIEGAASAVAKAENGGLYPVEGVLADDPKNDLVLLKLKGKDLPFLTLCTNETVEVGTRIAVIGSPLGLEGTISEGIVSAIRQIPGVVRLLQTTAAISPGSSGSPVLNENGEVIGVASAILSGGQSLNFAIPIEAAEKLIKSRGTAIVQSIEELAKKTEEEISSTPEYRAFEAGPLEPGHKFDARIFLTTTQRTLFNQIYPDFDEKRLEKDWEWKDVDPIALFTPEENRKRRRELFLYEYTPYSLNDAEKKPDQTQVSFKKVLQNRFPEAVVLMTQTTFKLVSRYEPSYEDLPTLKKKDLHVPLARNVLKLTAGLGVQWARFGGTTLYIYNGPILMSKYSAGYVSLAYPNFDRPPR